MRNTPFLQLDLRAVCARLCGDEFLEVADGVIRTAFDADWVVEIAIMITIVGNGEEEGRVCLFEEWRKREERNHQ